MGIFSYVLKEPSSKCRDKADTSSRYKISFFDLNLVPKHWHFECTLFF